MNTENKKSCCRYLIFILFWAVIIALGFMLIPKAGSGSGTGTGTGQHGSGSGSGDHGSGSGKGQGDTGVNDGKSRSGNSARSDAGKSNKTVSAVAKTGSEQGQKDQKEPQDAAGSGQLPIVSKDKAAENVATIYLAGMDPDENSNSGTSAGFFGVKASGPVLFLLDISGSMASSTADGGISRLDLVKKEVEKTLLERHGKAKAKRSSDHFRIVCFSSGCRFFPDENTGGYKFSLPKNVSDAIDFVKALSPCGGTQMMHAWQAIIPILKRDEISSVYFLSDGDPTDCNAASLMAFLKQEVPDLTIHSISMGKSSQLLKDVAHQHNGQYKEVF